MSDALKVYSALKRLVRHLSGYGESVKVQFLQNYQPPRLVGEKHISAFRDGEWKTIRASTLRVTVGDKYPVVSSVIKDCPGVTNFMVYEDDLQIPEEADKFAGRAIKL